MSIALNDHVGKRLVALTLMEHSCNPDIEAALSPDTNAEVLAAVIHSDLETVFRKHLGDGFEYSHRELLVKVHARSGIIKSLEERNKEFFAVLSEIGELQRDGEDELVKRNQNNPDNGKFGWWRVRGVRHSCLVQCDNAVKAIQIAEEKELVGNWESPEATFWTVDLPRAFRC